MEKIHIKKNKKNIFMGYIIKEQFKTVVVEVKKTVKHNKYKKILNKSLKYIVHDKKNECCIGDIVLIKQSKPYSVRKKWIITKILKKNYIR